MALTIYQYPKCSTCRKALAWLDRHGYAYTSVDIVAHPPSRATLERAAKLGKIPVKKLFNVSGVSYRTGGFKERLPELTDAQALGALAADGKLVKRPLLIAEHVALAGFAEDEWRRALDS